MNRSYLAPHEVTVFKTHADYPDKPVKTVKTVPFSRCGMDSYDVDGVMYPGYDFGCEMKACIYLDRPMFEARA